MKSQGLLNYPQIPTHHTYQQSQQDQDTDQGGDGIQEVIFSDNESTEFEFSDDGEGEEEELRDQQSNVEPLNARFREILGDRDRYKPDIIIRDEDQQQRPLIESILYPLFRIIHKNLQIILTLSLLLILSYVSYLTTAAYLNPNPNPTQTNTVAIPINPSDTQEIQRVLQGFRHQLQEFDHVQKLKMEDLKKFVDLKCHKFDQDVLGLSNEIIDLRNHISLLKDSIDQQGDQLTNDEIVKLVSDKFKENKSKLIKEIKSITKPTSSPAITIPTDQAKRKKKNYSLYTSGARLINYLTSPPFNPRTTSANSNSKEPISDPQSDQLQSPMVLLTTTETSYKSSALAPQLAIRFMEYIHITEVSYTHDLYSDPAGVLACPKVIELYLDVIDYQGLISEIESLGSQLKIIEGNYIYVSSLNYQINKNNEQEQWFDIADYIKKYLVRSIIFKVKDSDNDSLPNNGNLYFTSFDNDDSLPNNGNLYFTSLYKFYIGGLTKFDILALNQMGDDNDNNNNVSKKNDHDLGVHLLNYYGIKDTAVSNKVQQVQQVAKIGHGVGDAVLIID
ncbi:hypothetical protein WICPIJ_009459 [Wickerhamomyces pijperi]|uniref:SUN domain-containing protein n=1 Tax=Wickerhamomyces pijperi TaxID=599730 RepID=A0A9P8PMI5_WICPI|nr:hypothetical protein WICPIJ_009459 [Wickerhamomyces pijperi]